MGLGFESQRNHYSIKRSYILTIIRIWKQVKLKFAQSAVGNFLLRSSERETQRMVGGLGVRTV